MPRSAPFSLERRVLFVAALGSLLSSLSSSIVGVVLPRIGEWAGLGVQDVAWVTLVPMLVIAVCLIPAGWAGDTFGHWTTYVAGSAFATVGSLGCALAPDFAVLLVFRGVQGVGAALAMASAPALVTLATAPTRRGGALGVTSSALYVGLTLGPPLGGWLDSLAGFRAVFYAQVPLSLVLFTVCLKGLPRSGWLGGPAREPGGRRPPLLDLHLFTNRSFVSATLGAFLNYVALFHANFLLPFYLVDERGMDTGHAGSLLMVMPLLMSVVAGPSGSLSDRMGSRSLASGGMLLMAAGLWLLAMCDAASPLGLVVATQVLMGVGTGVFVAPNTSTLMASAPRQVQGTAASVMALARTGGMMVGTAMAATVHEAVLAAGVREGMTAAEAGVSGLQAAWRIGAVVALAAAGVVLVRSKENHV